MGMNIYTLAGVHVGKRSADGIWCWDCRVRPIDTITNTSFEVYYRNLRDMLDKSKNPIWKCPKCGATEIGKYNPVYVELGFDKPIPIKHSGLDGASRFTWQMGEYGLGKSIDEVRKRLGRYKYLVDEYGRKMNIDTFWDMFKNIIVEDYSDREFS